jgi:hypothetical protein
MGGFGIAQCLHYREDVTTTMASVFLGAVPLFIGISGASSGSHGPHRFAGRHAGRDPRRNHHRRASLRPARPHDVNDRAIAVGIGGASGPHEQSSRGRRTTGSRFRRDRISEPPQTKLVTEPAQLERRTGFRTLVRDLRDDFKHLPSAIHSCWGAIGGALGLAARPIDQTSKSKLANHGRFFGPGASGWHAARTTPVLLYISR